MADCQKDIEKKSHYQPQKSCQNITQNRFTFTFENVHVKLNSFHLACLRVLLLVRVWTWMIKAVQKKLTKNPQIEIKKRKSTIHSCVCHFFFVPLQPICE